VSNCSVKLAGVTIFFAVPAIMAPCPVLNEVKEFTRDRILWTTQLVHMHIKLSNEYRQSYPSAVEVPKMQIGHLSSYFLHKLLQHIY